MKAALIDFAIRNPLSQNRGGANTFIAGILNESLYLYSKILIQQESHAGESASVAKKEAYSRHASMSSRVNSGKFSRISSLLSPAAKWLRMICTGILVPFTHGTPPQISGFEMMRPFALFMNNTITYRLFYFNRARIREAGSKDDERGGSFGCGSIDIKGHGPSGPSDPGGPALVLALLALPLILRLRQRARRTAENLLFIVLFLWYNFYK